MVSEFYKQDSILIWKKQLCWSASCHFFFVWILFIAVGISSLQCCLLVIATLHSRGYRRCPGHKSPELERYWWSWKSKYLLYHHQSQKCLAANVTGNFVNVILKSCDISDLTQRFECKFSQFLKLLTVIDLSVVILINVTFDNSTDILND